MAVPNREELQHSLLCGHIIELPPEPSKIVRIFISSTFGDSVAERNTLLQKAYPTLQQWCQRHGLDFQVVDMRWGVRSEATVDHRIGELCLREIRTCQKISAGPNFVCFLGQRYGYRPLTPEIEEKEFEILRKCSKECKLDDSLLLEWYKKDDNAVPPRYTLQPITTKFEHYHDVDPANQELREKQSSQWMDIFQKLVDFLRKAAEKAFQNELITEETRYKYFMSVTESEIRAAVDIDDVNQHCVCFMRTLNNVKEADPAAHMYRDSDEHGKPKEEEQALLEKVRNQFIPEHYNFTNVHSYDLEWMKGGIDPSEPEHKRYLENFCVQFVTDIKRLVEGAVVAKSKWKYVYDSPLFVEIAHQTNFCLAKCTSFCGREDILNDITQYVVNNHNKAGHKPAVVFGVSGSGKTSIMAIVARDAHKNLSTNCVSVLRFLGTSSRSTSILHVLGSVCQQICRTYDISTPTGNIWENYNDLVAWIPSLLQQVSQDKSGRPLLIILDSLDQLSESHSPYGCNWLPKSCPPNVSIIVSTLPNEHSILENLLQSMVDDNNYFQVRPLQEGAGNEIFQTWMTGINRQVTSAQKKIFKDAFSRCRQPLFLKLAFDQARLWKSYTPIGNLNLGDSVRSAIGLLYERLEKQHGKILVSHALGYITAARNGLTEAELDDVLSIDDEVLDDVYQYWSPPNPDVVRIPPLLWARLKYDLQEYLVNRHANGKTVMALYHRQFIETAKDRYLKGAAKAARHQILAEFFLGKWSQGTIKPIHLSQRKESYHADRKVSYQPIKYRKVFNLRKLEELPYHLLYADNDEQLIENGIGNFKLLDAVIRGLSVQDFLEDINLMISEKQGTDLCEELVLIRGAIRLARPTLEYVGGVNYECVALEILGRLLQFADKYPRCIGILVAGAEDWCDRHRHSLLVPQRGCFPAPGGPLRTTLIGHQDDILDMTVNQDKLLLVTASRDYTVRVWNLETDEVIHTLQAHSASGDLDAVYCVAITDNGKWLVSGAADDTLIVWSLRTGEIIHKLPESHCYYYLHAPLATVHNSNMAVSVDGVRISVHDIVDGKRMLTLKGHTNAVCGLHVTPDDKYIVSASDDTTVKVWSLDTGDLLHDITQHTDDITSLTVSANYAISGSRDKTALVIDVATGNIVHKLENQHPVSSVCVSPDEKCLATGSGQEMMLWNLKSGELQHTCAGHDGTIDCVCISYDSKYVVSGARDDIMVVWEMETGKLVHTLEGQQAIVSHLALAKYLVVSASLKSPYIKLWNITPEQAKEKRQTFPDKSGIVDVTTSCQYVVYRSDNGCDIKVWDIDDREDKYTLVGHTAEVKCLVITHDNKYVLSGSEDKSVILWHIKSGEGMHIFPEQPAAIQHLNLNRNDTHFISACKDNNITLWSMREKSLKAVTLSTRPVTSVALTNSSVMIYGTRDGIICQYNPKNSKTHTMKGHRSTIQCLVLSDDSRMLASSAMDPYIIIWNVDKRKKLKTISVGSTDIQCDVNHLAFSGDNRFLSSAASDKQVKLYRVQDGCLVTTQYVYSNLTSMKMKYYCIIGGTRIGQLLVLKIHYVENEGDECSDDDISQFGSRMFPHTQRNSSCCTVL